MTSITHIRQLFLTILLVGMHCFPVQTMAGNYSSSTVQTLVDSLIKEPEAPITMAFTPDLMNSIPLANPTSKVEMIRPPEFNNQGSAELSYNFEMPPARNGMQPQLGIRYNSDAGTGRLANGWDWNLSSITKNPQGNSYLLDGQELLAGVGSLSGRFYPRREKDFKKIIREDHTINGNTVHTWVVTDQRGTKYYYGSVKEDKNGNLEVSGVFSRTGTVSEWKLTRIEELHGDYVEYIYDEKGKYTADLLLPDTVRAGNKDEDAHTVVKFSYDSRQFLSAVSVSFEYSKDARTEDADKYKLLRQYTFEYSRQGDNNLLKKIDHYYYTKDGVRIPFANHTFDYYYDKEELEKLENYIKRTGKTGLNSLMVDRTGKLKTVHNPLGGCFTINYDYTLIAGMTCEIVPPLLEKVKIKGENEQEEEEEKEIVKLVMKSIRINDGVKDDGTNIKYETAYEKGKYDCEEKVFLGYEYVDIRQIDTDKEDPQYQEVYRQTRRMYDVSSYYTCTNLLRSIMTGPDISDKYTEEIYEYYNYRRGTNNQLSASPLEPRPIAFTPLKYSKTILYSGSSNTVTAEKYYEYNLDYGGLQNYTYSDKGTLGNMGTGAYNYRLHVIYNSQTDNSNIYIVNLPVSVRVVGDDSEVYRKTDAIYGAGGGNRGKITGIRKTLDAAGNQSLTKIEYDEWGNITKKTMPDRMEYSYLYDRDYNTYVERVTDSHGYITEMEKYDYRYGIPRITRDMNRYTLEQTIDDLGRVDTIISPNEQESGKKFTILYEYSPLPVKEIDKDCSEDLFEQEDMLLLNVPEEIYGENPFSEELIQKIMGTSGLAGCPREEWKYATRDIPVEYITIRIENCFCTDKAEPVYALTKRYDYARVSGDNYNCIETALFVDGMGRVIQEQRDAAVTTSGLAYNHTEQEQKVVSGRIYYDAFGRAVKTYYPTTTAVSSRRFKETGTFDGDPLAEMEYDLLDRVTKVTRPSDDTEFTTDYRIDGNSLISTVSFFNSSVIGSSYITKECHTSASGLITKEKENDFAVTTDYTYDPIGQLTGIEKGVQHVEYKYDLSGKVTEVTSPVKGQGGVAATTTRFTYDDAGNLIRKQTGNFPDEGIEYEYDFSRLTKIKYPHQKNDVTYTYGGKNASHNRVGRIMLQEDASGAQEFFYGRQGEVSKVRRTIVIPNQAVATYVTQWQYDSWNRLTEIIYPDGEKVAYTYNSGGLVDKMTGGKTYCYDYITKIGYDKFNQRVYMKYGNKLATTYQYLDDRGLMSNFNVLDPEGGEPLPPYNYAYNEKNDIVRASFGSLLFTHRYMYTPSGNLFFANGESVGLDIYYNMEYHYGGYDIPLDDRIDKHQIVEWSDVYFAGDVFNMRISELVEQYDGKYDLNGNLTEIAPYNATGTLPGTVVGAHKFLWDEENRLEAIKDGIYTSHYLYDAQGNRVVKTGFGNEKVYFNAGPAAEGGTGSDFTAYINPYMEVTKGGAYTKHFFIGNERIVSKLGDLESFGADPRRVEYAGHDIEERKVDVDYAGKYTQSRNNIKGHYADFDMEYYGGENNDYVNGSSFVQGESKEPDPEEELKGNVDVKKEDSEDQRYFYHSNHLGSTMALTDKDGELTQMADYLPFGELVYEERGESWNTRYLYHGKEFDEETGFYYYDGRFYFPAFGIWLNASSPLDRNSVLTPYVFKNNNPETK